MELCKLLDYANHLIMQIVKLGFSFVGKEYF